MAVKFFISANRQQFTNERMIYRLLLDHENVARFLESEERVGTEGRTEFLLLLEFYPHVSITTTLRNPNQLPRKHQKQNLQSDSRFLILFLPAI